jgi:ribosomal protein S18 acetylase RimI-like enzyme
MAVTTYYLEMTDAAALRPCTRSHPELIVTRSAIPCPEFNRFLYTTVGGPWQWVDRLSWPMEQWQAYVDRPELATWVGYVEGTPAGYFELERQPGDQVEIAYFGLLPQFMGQGLGGALLTSAIEHAWDMGAERVWVHTCTLDAPTALANYRARGMRVYKEESEGA